MTLRPGPGRQDGAPARGRFATGEVAAFVRTLALVGSAFLLALLLVFAAAQGALDGNPATPRYWTRWWPVWLLAAPLVTALAFGITGRPGRSLAWSAGALLLLAALILAKLAASG